MPQPGSSLEREGERERGRGQEGGEREERRRRRRGRDVLVFLLLDFQCSLVDLVLQRILIPLELELCVSLFGLVERHVHVSVKKKQNDTIIKSGEEGETREEGRKRGEESGGIILADIILFVISDGRNDNGDVSIGRAIVHICLHSFHSVPGLLQYV